MHHDTWQFQEAKAKLDEVLRAAVRVPQTIIMQDECEAVIISKKEYDKNFLTHQSTLGKLIDDSPLKGIELELQRNMETMRNANLFNDDK